MRSLLLTLSLAGFSAAIPLRKGASWTWRVVDLKTNQVDYRSAVVTDSSLLEGPLASGTLWSIGIRDSTTGDADTAKLLANGTSQTWHSGSHLLPIEPKPWNGTDVSWGRVALASLRNGTSVQDYSIVPATGGAPTIKGTFFTGMYNTTSTIDAPRGIWSDSLGVERFQLQQKEWTLIRCNGETTSLPPSPLSIPDSGATFEWQHIETSASYVGGIIPTFVTQPMERIRWTIASRVADSSGWKVLQIREIRNGGRSDTAKWMRWAMNPSTKERFPLREASEFLPDDAWRTDWSDSILDGTRQRSSIWSSNTWSTINPKSHNSTLIRIEDNTLDSSMVSSSFSSNISPRTDITTVYMLLSVGSKVIRTALPDQINGITPRQVATRPDLARIARIHPGATVRWSDPQGRSGTTSVGQFLSSRPSAGMLHLSVRLPDGSTWQGARLTIER
jgi:hypothetical protein